MKRDSLCTGCNRRQHRITSKDLKKESRRFCPAWAEMRWRIWNGLDDNGPSWEAFLHAVFPHERSGEGICILHPAWYRKHWAPKGSIRSRLLRRIDYFLQWTPFWNFGEYSLYVFENPNMDAK